MQSPPPDGQNGRTVTPANDIHLNIPRRFYLVPGAAIIVGAAIGLVRGSQTTSLRFLAENVHRPPTTVQGWYFYNKTKNYKVLLGGVKGAGVEASKLAVIASGWVGIEEGLERAGWGQVSELGAAVGTAGVCSAVCESAALRCRTGGNADFFRIYRPTAVESDEPDAGGRVNDWK